MSVPSVYSVEVPSDSRALQGLIPYLIDGRDPRLPLVYMYEDGEDGDHPLRGDSTSDGRTFVLLVDTTRAGKKAAHALAETLDVPYGPIGTRPTANPALRGLLELEPGDFVFARDKDGDGIPEDDILQAFVGESYDEFEDQRADVSSSRLALLGPRSCRRSNAVWFEQQPRAHPVKAGQRCYGMSSMTQQPKLTEGPPASMKVVDNELDETQEVVREALRAITSYNMSAWNRQSPLDMRTCLQEYASMINAPAIGSSENTMWSSIQVNFARPQRVSAERSLAHEMGVFGGPHRDTRDCVTSLSCALVLSDIPRDYESGRFHLLGLGVFTALPLYRQFFFSGLLRHGGTSPLAPNSATIPDWAHRMLVICYPHTSFVFGNVKHTLAALPYSGLPFHLTQEMTGAPHASTSEGLWTSRSNYANDGVVVMEPEAHFRFFVRGLLQAVFMFLQQLPSTYGVEVDAEALLGSITMALGDVRVSADDWQLAPTGSVNDRFTAEHKRVQEAVLKTLYDHMARGIPSIQTPHPLRDFDMLAPLLVGRPRDYHRFKDSTRFENDSSADEARGRKRRPYFKRGSRTKRRSGPSVVLDTSSEDGDDESSDSDTLKASRQKDNVPGKPAFLLHAPAGEHHRKKRKRASSSSDEYVPVAAKITRLNESSQRRQRNPSSSVTSGVPADTPRDDGHESGHSAQSGGRFSPTVTDLALRHGTPIDEGLPISIDEEIAEAAFGEPEVAESVYRHRECSLFVRRFNTSSIWGVIRRVNDVLRDVKQASASTLSEALSCMEDIESTLSDHSLALSDIPSYSLSLLKLRQYCDANEIWASVYRARIMTSESLTTRSIHTILENECPRIIASNNRIHHSQDWLTRLTLTVLQLVRSGVAVRADSSAYLGADGGICPKFEDSDDAVRRRKNLRNIDVTTTTCSYVGQILQRWFAVPPTFIAKSRALFVDLLDEHLGHTSLLMPFVWEVYVQLPSWLFTANSPTKTELEYHPETPFLSTFLSGFAATLAKSPEAVVARTHLRVLQRQFDQLWTSAYAATQADSRGANASPMQGSFRSRPDDNDNTPTNYLQTNLGSAVSLIERFLYDGWVAAEAAFNGDFDLLTDEQSILANEGDFLIPIRELAPSRRLVNMPAVGIDNTFAQSAAGLFSLLVFRNISFNTEAFRRCSEDMRQIRFNTLEEWDHYVDILQNAYQDKPIDFICNRFSYGQPLPHRSIELATGFWDVAHKCKWPIPSATGQLPTFASAMRWIKQLKSSYKEKLVDFGLLGQYMLAADMVACGVVEVPTCVDVGTIIDQLNAGGKRGLQDLRIISASATRSETVEAFSTLFETVRDALPEGELSKYQWNTITAEHMLCKLHRMQNRGYYKN